MTTSMPDIIEMEVDALRNICLDEFGYALTLIFDQVHQKGGKVITSGMGKAGHIAHNIATTFSSTGTPAVFLHPSEAQHGDLGIMQPHDIMLLISNSGNTVEITQLMSLAENLYPHVKFICITSNPHSEVSDRSDVTLYTGNPKEVCPLGMSPTTSTTVMTVMGDILISKMMSIIEFTVDAYAKRHHGGYLGEKSREMK